MYYARIVEKEIKSKLDASGAIVINGPKSCGKTETAKQFAKSILQVDQDIQVPAIMDIDPKILLSGDTPRLLDEWQEQPKLWNYVRHEVDNRKQKGQFILTGSANPEEDSKTHSGAGRFTIVEMQTMSWQEMGFSSGEVSISDVLKGLNIPYFKEELSLDLILDRMIKGGWPALLNQTTEEAILLNRAYLDLVAEVDMSRVSQVKRDSIKVKALLRSLARNISTEVENVTLEKDIKKMEDTDLSRPSILDYLMTLERLLIVEEQPAYNTHIRSANSLRKAPKRHFCDVSLAIAALKLTKDSLYKDLKYCGFLFESLVYHDIKVYAKAHDAEVFHYRDSTGLEIDIIVQQSGGAWAAFEVKLGIGSIEEAAMNLKKLEAVVDTTKKSKPSSLNILTGDGMSYTRKDGINVISIASIGI